MPFRSFLDHGRLLRDRCYGLCVRAVAEGAAQQQMASLLFLAFPQQLAGLLGLRLPVAADLGTWLAGL